MRFVENRKLAVIVLIICVLISIFGFGGGALKNERYDVQMVFSEGTDTSLSTRHSLDAYLDRAAERANMLAEQGDKFAADADLVAAVRKHVENLSASDGLDERHKAYTELRPAVEKLFTALEQDYSDTEIVDAKLAYNDFKGAVNLIQNDQYPALASKFNEKLNAFPASFIGGLFGVEPLNTFGW